MPEQWQHHKQLHPIYAVEDEVKFVFQAMLGCGHLVSSEQKAHDSIMAEMALLQPDANEPLTEPLSDRFMRLNLRAAMARGIKSEWIAHMLYRSAQDTLDCTRSDVVDRITQWRADGLMSEQAVAHAKRLLDEPDWLPSHSDHFRAAYAPAYRVVSNRYALALPALTAIADADTKDKLLITIDGRCGSGKSTLAALLADLIDAPIIHMDDFYVPHAQKTPERLSHPGGNADVERLCAEFLHPWLADGTASYRPYDCFQDCLKPAIHVPAAHCTILEGTYCNLPDIARHADIRLFLLMDEATQRHRLLMREGEAGIQRFINRWIPLEEAYFSGFSLPDSGCVVLPVPTVT